MPFQLPDPLVVDPEGNLKGWSVQRDLEVVADALNQSSQGGDSKTFQGSPAHARVFNNAAITLTNNVAAFLTFNSERWDTGNFHSTSTNTSRLTAPTAGLYSIGGVAEFAANATGTRQLAVAVNGTTFINVVEVQANGAAGRGTALDIDTQYRLAAGDYVELRALQSSGGNLNVTANANFSPEFWIVRLGSYA